MFGRKSNVKKYKFEPTAVQLRIIRSHIAAQAGQLSTLTTLLTELVDKQRQANQPEAPGVCKSTRCLNAKRHSEML